ncbi:MAG TPA: hypothetical protein VMF86_14320 [Stellaceae bacterium]|jgi:hypothetical protein|nr:hypothetical protein [Stellaceae bacterium]HTW51856.1 hypothetical protein [Stellaceae bacterium]
MLGQPSATEALSALVFPDIVIDDWIWNPDPARSFEISPSGKG